MSWRNFAPPSHAFFWLEWGKSQSEKLIRPTHTFDCSTHARNVKFVVTPLVRHFPEKGALKDRRARSVCCPSQFQRVPCFGLAGSRYGPRQGDAFEPGQNCHRCRRPMGRRGKRKDRRLSFRTFYCRCTICGRTQRRPYGHHCRPQVHSSARALRHSSPGLPCRDRQWRCSRPICPAQGSEGAARCRRKG